MASTSSTTARVPRRRSLLRDAGGDARADVPLARAGAAVARDGGRRARAARLAGAPTMPLLVGAAAIYGCASFTAGLSGPIAAGLGVSAEPALTSVPFCAAFGLGVLAWGRVADRRGRMPVALLALLGCALAGIAVATAQSAAWLVVARIAQGAAAAGYPPAAQALLAARATADRTGRAVGGMFVGVVAGMLGAPLLAAPLADAAGWRATTLILGAALPAAALAWLWVTRDRAAPDAVARTAWPSPTLPLLAGCAVAALSLGAYWTLITRLHDLLEHDAFQVSAAATAALTIASGLAGAALVVLASRIADRHGPKAPATVTLALGGAALVAAAAQQTALGFALAAGAFMALYWSYLPIVAVQVTRSATAPQRATALGLFYASMWLGAAVAGVAAAAVGDWRAVVAGAGALWLLGALIALLGFHRGPAR